MSDRNVNSKQRMQLVPPVLLQQYSHCDSVTFLSVQFVILKKGKVNIPVHEDNSFTESSVTNTPYGNGFWQDTDGRVLQINAAARRYLRHEFTLEFRRKQTNSQSYMVKIRLKIIQIEIQSNF